MSVRFKILICLIGVGASLWLASVYFASHVFLDDFEQLDEIRITQNVNRVYGLIQDFQNQALNACQLWENGSSNNDPGNFLRTIMETNGISLITTFNTDGSVRESLAIPRGGNAAAASLPQADLELFRQQVEHARSKGTPIVGILESSRGPLLFAADAKQSGANTGGIFSAIVLDEAFNQKLERNLLMDVRLVPATEELLQQFPANKDEALFQPDDLANSNLIGAKLLRDTKGNPLVVLKIVATKDIGIAGKQNLQFFIGATAATGIAILIIGALLVDFWVVRRIRKLTQSARHADQFGTMEDLPRHFTRIPDEVSQLALAIRRMVERMRSSQTMYRAIIETQTEMIVRYAPDGTITFTNEAFAKWLHLHPKSVLSANLHTLLADRAEDADQIKSPLDPTNRHRSLLIAAVGKEGIRRTLEWNEHGIFDATRKLTEVQALGRDVTEQVEHEARLREARDQAQQADHAKGEFLAVLGHETRTPLTSILGFSSILENTPLNDEQREYLAAIRSSGNSLLTLLNDILDYTRIAAGQIELRPKTVDVVEILKEIVATHTIEARAKQLNLDTEIAPEAPLYFVADETRLKQVLSNLVGNAIKFTRSGFVRFGVRAEGETHIRFFVEDSGDGIPAEKRHLLFKPFSQITSALTRDVGGTGIGLAFSKRLVELMGGTIGLSDEEHSGAFFHFELPIGKPVIPERSPARLAELVALDSNISSGVRILLVEDNKVNQKLTTRLLQMIGFKCDIASDGLECLEMTELQDYDLIFLDIQMPRIDGFETARRIRQRERDSASGHITYLVALTAFTLPGDREKCLAAGMDNFVGKPIRIESLEAAIENWRKEMLAVSAG